MARTHSSYTGSPRRTRSPQRNPAHHTTSEDGSQYEMDLDALGLNSTFESTTLEANCEPPPDRVDTSDIEGPDDFTMNMTYWMTADLPPAVKSRKEAKSSRPELRLDASHAVSEGREEGEQRDGAVMAASTPNRGAARLSTAASPTVRVDGTTASREYSTPASERSMENDEKVRSFLSALPDADLDHTLAGTPLTPLRVPHQSLLQVPRSSPPKARSLQATVEDYDIPRKPTQQTVIHHPSPTTHATHDAAAHRIAQLQSQLEQHELASRTRITELETILSHTQSELDGARNDNYKHKDSVARLQEQRDGFQRQLTALESSKRSISDEAEAKSRALESVQAQLIQLKQSNEEESQRKQDAQTEQDDQIRHDFAAERTELRNKLESVQTRADTLQADLARATAEAKAAREQSQLQRANNTAAKAATDRYSSRIAYLETQLQDTNFSLECAQADVAAKDQLFQINLDLNDYLRALRSELDAQRSAFTDLTSRTNSHQTPDLQLQSELAAKEQLIIHHINEKDALSHQLSTAQGRISGLESTLTTLRQQLADAHRESAQARTETERISQDLEDANDRLQEARAEADRRVADVEKKLAKTKDAKTEAEHKLRELKSQHDDLVEGHAAMLEDVRDKAEDAVRKTATLLSQEKKEKSRLTKDLRKMQHEMDSLREEVRQTANSDDSDDTTAPTARTDTEKDQEIQNLRATIQTQATEIKTLKSTHASCLTALQTRLATQAQDHALINAALDDKLSVLLTRLMKDRARTLVSTRDGQWEQNVEKVAREREVLGKALLTQWGREECGGVEEGGKGRGQVYGYKYVKRER